VGSLPQTQLEQLSAPPDLLAGLKGSLLLRKGREEEALKELQHQAHFKLGLD